MIGRLVGRLLTAPVAGAVLIRLILGLHKTMVATRLEMLRAHGATVGQNVFFEGAVNDYKDAPFLTVEDGATVSQGTLIILHDSSFNNVSGLPIKFGKVTIGQDSYVGANCTITCGVRIGKGAIVGAHSLVTKDVPDGAVAYGVPARVVGTVAEIGEKQKRKAQLPDERFFYFDSIPWRDRTPSAFRSVHSKFVAQAVDRSHRKSDGDEA